MRVIVTSALVVNAALAGKCCWSKFGDASTCGNYPTGQSGQFCGDTGAPCKSDSDCTGGPGPSPSPSPSPSPTPGPGPLHKGGILGGYFANWAQYHKAPYKHVASSVAPIAKRTDHIYFGFMYFCPPAGTSPMPYWASYPYGSCSDSNEFSVMTVEKNDPQSIQTLVGQGPKVIASIGGWNFPSEYFSKMVATSESRQKFISSAKDFITKHGMKGIDIDWEYPCSPARQDPVKITCEKFRTTADAGGSCPADKDNLLLFLKELRAALGDDMYISVASQAAEKNWVNMNLKEGSAYVDHWHVMNYDYTVPDIAGPGGATMSPNQPLYTPSAKGSLQMSVDYTVKGYLAAGVPASKIMVGVAFYGHTWYAQGMSDWQSFGGTGSIQGECCGPFKQTYGAKPGMACQQCGVMMYSEIEAAGCDTTYDDETQSDIMYCSSAGKDSYTEAGTWITYQGKKSIAAVTNYSIANNLGGLFIFDTSMDTVSQGGQFSFELMNLMADQLDAATPSPPAPSPPAPTPPAPTPAGDMYKCVNDQCVSSATGVSKEVCGQVCSGAATTTAPPTTTTALYKCTNNQCVASDSGVDMDTCSSLCESAFVLL